MASIDFKDFYILYQGHPRYQDNVIEEDNVINVILQKYEMILFTDPGEILGDPNFGAGLQALLFETNVSGQFVQDTINNQIGTYIPEITSQGYTLNVVFTQDPNNYQDMMFIYFQISDYQVYAQIGTTYGTF